MHLRPAQIRSASIYHKLLRFRTLALALALALSSLASERSSRTEFPTRQAPSTSFTSSTFRQLCLSLVQSAVESTPNEPIAVPSLLRSCYILTSRLLAAPKTVTLWREHYGKSTVAAKGTSITSQISVRKGGISYSM